MYKMINDIKTLRAFYDSYVDGDFEDPHTKFSKALGLSRQDAKVLCHMLAYKISQSKVVKDYFVEEDGALS